MLCIETQTENEAVAENWNWFGDQLSSNVVFALVSRQDLVTDNFVTTLSQLIEGLRMSKT